MKDYMYYKQNHNELYDTDNTNITNIKHIYYSNIKREIRKK